MEGKTPDQLIQDSAVSNGVGVGNFVAQGWIQRFPQLKEEEEHIAPPQQARWRSNLSALSQKFNLYFSAMRDLITITVPRDLRQTLPGTPDMVLELPITPEGVALGGYIDENLPHCVNHIKVGNYGDLEVLLIACDDGDILAYYTHQFRDEIQLLKDSKSDTHLLSTRLPFLHENVGSSSWGLAVHEKSRLIAVSSNLRQVTIFAHGLTAFRDGEAVPAEDDRSTAASIYRSKLWAMETNAGSVRKMFTGNYCHKGFKNRLFNFKMTLQLGENGHNIPSVDFVSDSEGNATRILAVDINGNLWVFNLVTLKGHCIPRVPSNPTHTPIMGWGVLSLPIRYFKGPISNEALAVLQDVLQRPYLPGTPAGHEHNDQLANDQEDAEGQEPQSQAIDSPEEAFIADFSLTHENAILRAFNLDIELIAPTYPNSSRTILMGIFEMEVAQLSRHAQLRNFDRLNMLAFIPELSLVVAASQIGLVALITPTKLSSEDVRFEAGGPLLLLVPELILPLELHNFHRPRVPLSGMAVSPLQTSEVGRTERWEGHRRWRLLMHYVDQTVLSYEIFRDGNEHLIVL